MGLFDWFRRRKKQGAPIERLCYDIAYFVLPQFAFNGLTKVTELCLNAPTAAGPFFYLMACQMRKAEPDREAAAQFHWTHGDLDDDRIHYTLEYPEPRPIDMSDATVEQVMAGVTLAPHFSAIVQNRLSNEINYFVLGQAPIGGGTTFRCVTSDGANCNLGPGPTPNLPDFLAAICQYLKLSSGNSPAE